MNTKIALQRLLSGLPQELKNECFLDKLEILLKAKEIKSSADLYNLIDEEYLNKVFSNPTKVSSKIETTLKPGNVLEIACGNGRLLSQLEKNPKFSGFFGIDNNQRIVSLIAKNTKAKIFLNKAENFNYGILPKIDNIIINNFFGMISILQSKKILLAIKKCLTPESIILIGEEKKLSANINEANQYLIKKYNFHFYFPFYKDFASDGYEYKKIKMDQLTYYLLQLHENPNN